MTRDEHRAKCIEAMAAEISSVCAWPDNRSVEAAIRAFDSLHGIARVDPIEATEEMMTAGRVRTGIGDRHIIWTAMSAAGDLTNPPEGKL
jgi:hypothetical protein